MKNFNKVLDLIMNKFDWSNSWKKKFFAKKKK